MLAGFMLVVIVVVVVVVVGDVLNRLKISFVLVTGFALSGCGLIENDPPMDSKSLSDPC